MTASPKLTSPVLIAVSLGGVLGSLARYGAGRIWPEDVDEFLTTTLWVNVLGCALLGVIMVLVTERGPVHPLWRPFLGPGFCGGFTTFSAYAVYLRFAYLQGESDPATVYLVITPVSAVVALAAATWATRLACGVRGPSR